MFLQEVPRFVLLEPPWVSSALYDPDRLQPGDLARQTGRGDALDDRVDVFVRIGLFLGEACPPASSRDYARLGQFLIDSAARSVPDRRFSRHNPSRPVTRTAEGDLHCPLRAEQDVTGRSHVTGNQHRLTDPLVPRRQIRSAISTLLS